MHFGLVPAKNVIVRYSRVWERQVPNMQAFDFDSAATMHRSGKAKFQWMLNLPIGTP
jgi:hypothetical protein